MKLAKILLSLALLFNFAGSFAQEDAEDNHEVWAEETSLEATPYPADEMPTEEMPSEDMPVYDEASDY